MNDMVRVAAQIDHTPIKQGSHVLFILPYNLVPSDTFVESNPGDTGVESNVTIPSNNFVESNVTINVIL